jgi:hypothetical protein
MQNNFHFIYFCRIFTTIAVIGFINVTHAQIRVDQNNNVGIGTSSPASKLHIVGRITPKFPNADKDNIAIGAGAGNTSQTGINNILFGYEAGKSIISGNNNFFAGYRSGQAFTQNQFGGNIFIGEDVGYYSTSGSDNILLGKFAGKRYINPSNIIAIGQKAGGGGLTASFSNIGPSVFIGGLSGQFCAGNYNVMVGYASGFSNTTGSNNVNLGYWAGSANTTGSKNLFIGTNSGNMNQTGEKIICIGDQSNTNSANLINSTAIGSSSIVNASNKIWLGNTTTEYIGGLLSWNTPSDALFKENISGNVPGLAFISLLQPKSYTFNTKKFTEHLVQMMPDSMQQKYLSEDFGASSAIRRTGFLAQEVDEACNTIGYDFDGITKPDPENPTSHYSISYASFVVPLVKAVQEQQVLIISLQDANAEKTAQINDLLARVAALEKK